MSIQSDITRISRHTKFPECIVERNVLTELLEAHTQKLARDLNVEPRKIALSRVASRLLLRRRK